MNVKDLRSEYLVVQVREQDQEFKNTRINVRKGMKSARREIEDGELLVQVINAFLVIDELLKERKEEVGR